MSRRVRGDMLVALTLAATALVVAVVVSDRAPPRPEPTKTGMLPTIAPTPTATPGWWGEETPGAYRLRPMPTLPAAGGGDAAGRPVRFHVKSCPTTGVRITSIETAGGGWWNLYGEAAIPNMWYWKAELSGDGGANWTLLYRSDSPRKGMLMEFDTGTVQPGGYLLRLTAVDRTGNYPKPCVVQVEVQR